MPRKEYSVETLDETPIGGFYKNKYIAILKCIFSREAEYVFEFDVDENDDYELTGCVFSKGRYEDE